MPKRRIVFAVAASIVVISVGGLWVAERRDASRGTAKRASSPDIILVTVDTLRADALGYAGNRDLATPFFDKLAREGVAFTNAHAHNVVTLPSHVNILTGLLPSQHGVRDNAGFVLDPSHRSIARILHEQGYATGAFIAAFPLDARYGLDEGFDTYDDEYPEGRAPTTFLMPQRSAPEVLERAIAWFDGNAGKPRFLWVHLYEPHAPYTPPAPFRERHPDDLYYGEVEATDDALGRYLTPLLDRNSGTLVIVTGDHGESLGEHGETTHGLFAYEATLKVPLILWERGTITPRRETRAVRHIDITPTILARLGLAVPEALRGESLLDIQASRDTYFESLTAWLNLGWPPLTGMIHSDHKYVDLPVAELYALVKDPRETRNIFDEQRRIAFGIRDLLAREAPPPSEKDRMVSSEESARLMSLGYVSGSASKRSYSEADDPKHLVRWYEMQNDIVTLYQNGDTAQAIDRAMKLIRERPEMSTTKDMLAFLLQESEKPDEAIEFLEREVAAGTASTSMRRRLGMVLSESGRAAKAVEILAEYEDSRDPDLLNAYGIALADTGRLQDAAHQFERVLELDETNATALANLGVVALRAGDPTTALTHLSRALAISPQMPLALNTIGVVFARMGDDQRAMESWMKAVDLDPEQYDALFNLSVVAQRAGRPDIAKKALVQFIRTAPAERYARDIAAAKQALAGLGAVP